ncbi:MAG: hypothetical protein AB1813_06365 [Verrucomicrobiota bacterium]|jgi:hypothetical protein
MALGLFAACAGTAHAVSLSLESEASVPTQQFSPSRQQPSEVSDALSWIAFANRAIPDARPMLDWERRDADEFFWSQFE